MTEIDGKELQQQFASDNYAGICPEAWSATAAANQGHVTAYGDDPWTDRASNAFRELFEADCEVFFVFNGTAANSLALASLCQSYHGVICCDSAHVETDECGAPEFFSNGSKLLVAHSADGKLTPESIHENWPPSARTFTTPSRASSPLRSRPRWAASTHWLNCAQYQKRARRMGSTCTWTARALLMPAPALVARPPN